MKAFLLFLDPFRLCPIGIENKRKEVMKRMKCPHFIEEGLDTAALCVGVVVPFEPSRIDRIHFCQTIRHRHCSLYRNAGEPLSLAIHQEVARAIG